MEDVERVVLSHMAVWGREGLFGLGQWVGGGGISWTVDWWPLGGEGKDDEEKWMKSTEEGLYMH